MEVLIFIISIIIYSAIYNNQSTGTIRNMRRNNYDSNIGSALLNATRETYSTKLESWIKENQIKNQLLNNQCVLGCYRTENSNDKPDDLCFYCKERLAGKKKGRLFIVKGNDEHVKTMWAIMNMEFNMYSDFNNIRRLYRSLNDGLDVKGGMIYYHENPRNKYPEIIVNKFAQNEYCKMEIEIINGKKLLKCTDIWSSESFAIIGEPLNLYVIHGDFIKKADKMATLQELKKRYKEMNLGTILDYEDAIRNVSQENKEQSTLNQNNIANVTKEEKEIINFEIKKYDERNLDL